MQKNAAMSRRLNKDGFVWEIKKNFSLYMFLVPAIVYFIIFSYIPMFGIIIPFKELNYTKGIWGSPWVGFKNFKFLFSTPDMWYITRNTVLYNVAFIVFGKFFGITFAILLNEVRSNKLKKLYQGVMFLPYFISWVIVGYMVYVFLGPEYGFVNKSLLEPMGCKGIEWYTSPQYWPYIIVFAKLWKDVGYSTIIYLAAIAGIDQEMYEAAILDGAGKFKQAIYVTLPCLKMAIVTTLLMSIGSIFSSEFGLFYYITRNVSTLYPTTQVLGLYTYRALRELGDFGMSSAAGIYQAVVGFVLVLFSNWLVRRVDSDSSVF